MQTPPELRYLKWLVTALAGTMIVGIAVIAGVLLLRLGPMAPTVLTPAGPVLPANINLPDGAEARAVTFGDGWVAIVTDTPAIVIFDAQTGDIRQSVALD